MDHMLAHDPAMVALAVALCLVGSLLGVSLWAGTARASDADRTILRVLTATTLGATIWTTHFIAMLGHHPGVATTFDPMLTAASIVIAVGGLWGTIAVHRAVAGGRGIAATGLALGATIAAMHYTGTAGYRAEVVVTWSASQIVLSLVCGVALATLAVGALAAGRVWLAAASFAAGVAALHFIGMMAMHYPANAAGLPTEGAGKGTLALAVTAASASILGLGALGRHMIERIVVAEKRERQKTLERDVLTGLATRAVFSDALRSALSDQAGLAMLMVDLDRFKPVNDVFGHQIGDEVLRRVGGRLIAATDPPAIVSRFGGDEFAVLMTAVDEDDDACVTAARIIDILSRPFLVDTRVIEIGASVGIVHADSGGTEEARLIRAADVALYDAKTSGGGCYKVYDEAGAERFEARRRLEYDLRRAVARQEFTLVFQPLVDAESEVIVGAEALLRWNHPTEGPVPPGVFVPLAEEIGLMPRIGTWVIDAALKEAANWPDHLKLSINLSPTQLYTPRLAQHVGHACRKWGVPPTRLEFEITESALLADDDAIRSLLGELSDMGVRLSLDDFGTGYSSLSYLHTFPLDRIKIDRSFVHEISANTRNRDIVQAISALGDALGLSVTAEGIETREDLDILRATSCDTYQGFLMGRPETPDGFARLLRQAEELRDAG